MKTLQTIIQELNEGRSNWDRIDGTISLSSGNAKNIIVFEISVDINNNNLVYQLVPRTPEDSERFKSSSIDGLVKKIIKQIKFKTNLDFKLTHESKDSLEFSIDRTTFDNYLISRIQD